MAHHKLSNVSTVQEIERAVEQLPPKDFLELIEWIDRKRQIQSIRPYTAFLNSYGPEDEGLYDHTVAR